MMLSAPYKQLLRLGPVSQSTTPSFGTFWKNLLNKTQRHLQGKQILTSHFLSSCHHMCLQSYFSPNSATLLPSQRVPPNIKFRLIPHPRPCNLSSAQAGSFSPSSLPLPPSPLSPHISPVSSH